MKNKTKTKNNTQSNPMGKS